MTLLDRIALALCYLVVCGVLGLCMALAMIATLNGLVIWP